MNGTKGWNPYKFSEGDETEEIVDEEFSFKVLKSVHEPPDSLKCDHMKSGIDDRG